MEATYCSFAVWTMPTKMPPSIWAEINVPGSPAHPHPQTHPHTHTRSVNTRPTAIHPHVRTRQRDAQKDGHRRELHRQLKMAPCGT